MRCCLCVPAKLYNAVEAMQTMLFSAPTAMRKSYLKAVDVNPVMLPIAAVELLTVRRRIWPSVPSSEVK